MTKSHECLFRIYSQDTPPLHYYLSVEDEKMKPQRLNGYEAAPKETSVQSLGKLIQSSEVNDYFLLGFPNSLSNSFLNPVTLILYVGNNIFSPTY